MNLTTNNCFDNLLSSNKFSIRVEADAMCFTSPNLELRPVSYPIPTFQGLIGMLKKVYWHPGIYYYINEISFFKKPMIENQGFNGVNPKDRNTPELMSITYYSNIDFRLDITQYVDESHYKNKKDGKVDLAKKHSGIFKKRILKNIYFDQPCLGKKQFPIRKLSLDDQFNQEKETSSWNENLGVVFHSFIPIYFLKDFVPMKFDEKIPSYREQNKTKNFPLYSNMEIKKGIAKYPSYEDVIHDPLNKRYFDETVFKTGKTISLPKEIKTKKFEGY